MTWSGLLLRARLWWERATWPLPAVGIVLALLIGARADELDRQVDAGLAGRDLVSTEAAAAVLAAIGGGMVTFTGFVFSFVVLMLQFGSSQYSPRTVSFFLRARTTQVILAVFLATITFSFIGLLGVGAARVDYSPQATVVLACLLLLASLIGFVVLIASNARVRVDAVVSRLGRLTRRRALRLARTLENAGWTRTSVDSAPAEDAMLLRYTGRGVGQVIAVDHRRLRALARRSGARLEITALVGDSVGPGTAIGYAAGGRAPTPRAVSRCLVVDVERSLRHDSAYSLRLLVDIALRALSPAVNDPTTAVRVLDEIDAALAIVAHLPLGPAEVDAGSGHAAVRNRTWADVVELALDEIILAGSTQPQVTRRIAALLDDLEDAVGSDRRGPVDRARASLQSEVSALPADQVRFRLTPDRQGIGGTRSNRAPAVGPSGPGA